MVKLINISVMQRVFATARTEKGEKKVVLQTCLPDYIRSNGDEFQKFLLTFWLEQVRSHEQNMRQGGLWQTLFLHIAVFLKKKQ